MSSLSTSDSLLSRARAREEAAWSRLIELYAPLVVHWVRASNLPDADGADVVQEVFRSAMGGIDRFRKTSPGDSFRGWLRVIARSKVSDHFRKRARQPINGQGSALERWPAPTHTAEDPTSSTSDGSAGSEAISATERGLHRLLLRRALEEVRAKVKANTFEAFQRTAIEGRSPQDVGEELGMTAGAVRVAKTRVLQRLRAALGEIE